MKDGQRVLVLLNRGMADEWVPGTVLDSREMKVELDVDPPGMSGIITGAEIADWLPSEED